MTVEVRPIAAHELADWVETLHIAFFVDRSAEDEAVFRLDVARQDMARTLAAFDGDLIAGTLYSYPAQLTLPGAVTTTVDAITAVTVRPTHRRRGLLTAMLQADLRSARERGESAAILLASEYPIYGRFGFGPATEQVEYSIERAAVRFTRTAAGRMDLVEPRQMREVAPRIFDTFRQQRPGQIDRRPYSWDRSLGLIEVPWSSDHTSPRCAVFSSTAGDAEGYLLYRVENPRGSRPASARLEVIELVAHSRDAYLGLWRYACEVDLVKHISARMRCIDEPLPWLLENPRVAVQQTMRSDLLWVRPLDVAAMLGARRYLSDGRLVIEVHDPLSLCGGRFAIDGGPDGASCRATDESADLSLGMQALGAISLGGVSLRMLATAGTIDEHRPGAVDDAERLFHWPVAPWCSTFF